MTTEEARQAKQGDPVIVEGRRTYITAVQLNGGVHSPYFRVDGGNGARYSYLMVRKAPPTDA